MLCLNLFNPLLVQRSPSSAHLVHLLQPLDVRLFGTYTHFYGLASMNIFALQVVVAGEELQK